MSEDTTPTPPPRSTRAAKVTAWAAAVAAVATLTILAFQFFTIRTLASVPPEGHMSQALKEALCVPYVNGVLELSAQGYSEAQIYDVYQEMAAPADPTDPNAYIFMSDESPSFAMETCGTPGEIIDTAKAAATK
ncbi:MULTISPECIES: hypothetical protein [unclassified Isoptericola]|uniref:hypothetical protein n=1 Tax=unclassified Isoptericola TaxID=2623355 RepID=UPI00365BAD95